jgi:hypothetical protein
MTTDRPAVARDTTPDFRVSTVTPTDLRSIHRHPLFEPSALAVCWPSRSANRDRSGGEPRLALVACRFCRIRHYVG